MADAIDCGSITNLKQWHDAMTALTKRGHELMGGPDDAPDDGPDDTDEYPVPGDAPPPKPTNANTKPPFTKKTDPKGKDDPKKADEYE